MFGKWALECHPYNSQELVRVVTGGSKQLHPSEARALDILYAQTSGARTEWTRYFQYLYCERRFILFAYEAVLQKIGDVPYYSVPNDPMSNALVDSATDWDLFACFPIWFDETYDGYQFFVFGSPSDFFQKTAHVLAIGRQSLIPSQDGTYFVPKAGAVCLTDLRRYEGILNRRLKQFGKDAWKEMKDWDKGVPTEITRDLQDQWRGKAWESEQG